MTQYADRVFSNSQSGMTLLEVIIALVIFTIIAGTGYSSLYQGIAVHQKLQQQQTFWQKLEMTMIVIEQDLNQARNLAPRVPIWDAVAFQGSSGNDSGVLGEFLKFARGGYQSFAVENISPYRRLSYRIREGVLYRNSLPGINMPENIRGTESELLAGVKEIELRYLHDSYSWVDRWPLRFTTEDAATLPRAVELIFHMDNEASFKRLFDVGSSY